MKLFLNSVYVVGLFVLNLLFLSHSTQAVSCPLITDKPYKSPRNSSVYYITSDCKKRPIKDAAVYFSHFVSWKQVTEVSEEELSAIPNHKFGALPWGPERKFEYGSIVKTQENNRVYILLKNGIKSGWYYFDSEDFFVNHGYKPEWIEDVSEEVLKNQVVKEVTSEDSEELVFKYSDSPRVYVVKKFGETMFKEHVLSEQKLKEIGYRFDRIPVFSGSIYYPEKEEYVSTKPQESTTCEKYINGGDGSYVICKGSLYSENGSNMQLSLENISSAMATLHIKGVSEFADYNEGGDITFKVGESKYFSSSPSMKGEVLLKVKLDSILTNNAVKFTVTSVENTFGGNVNASCESVYVTSGNFALCNSGGFAFPGSNFAFSVSSFDNKAANIIVYGANGNDSVVKGTKMKLTKDASAEFSAGDYGIKLTYKGNLLDKNAVFSLDSYIE